MAPELNQVDDGGDDGAPKWMVTFGDAITLLVTFFVLLLTYSTPNERDLQQVSSGFLGQGGRPGARSMSEASPIKVPQSSLANSDEVLSRTEFPPLYKKLSEKADQEDEEGMDVSMLPTVENAIVVRLELGRVFGNSDDFSEAGEQLMRGIAGVLVAFPRVVIVRSRLGEEGTSEREQLRESSAMSRKIVGKLQSLLPQKGFDFRVSTDISLSPEELEPGYCEVLMLQQ